jgi:S-adenosylmethionine/arginine decarboxylase-like enzyme
MFSHSLTELNGITGPLLGDEAGLAALAIAAAGAIGLNAYGPPTTRAGPRGIAIGLLGHGGHIVLHAVPGEGSVLVDVVTSGTTQPARAVEVIARRLGATVSPASARATP